LFSGEGTMIWKSGFQFSGSWARGKPEEECKKNAIHPLLKSAINRGECTSSITGRNTSEVTGRSGQYGQFLYKCDNCVPLGNQPRKEYCASCRDLCHSMCGDHKWRERWTGASCSCVDEPEDCKAIRTSPPAKRQKQQSSL
jgi:hypothetical protein